MRSIEAQAIALIAEKTSPQTGPTRPWADLTTKEKAKALSLDVIQAVLAGVYEPIHAGYMDRNKVTDAAHKANTDSVQEALESNLLQDCRVDVIGALFLSHVRFENHCSIHLLSLERLGVNSGSGRRRLISVFGAEQVDAIESAYDCEVLTGQGIFLSDDDIPHKKLLRAAVAFGKKRSGDFERMLAIMINIVENDGTFKP